MKKLSKFLLGLCMGVSLLTNQISHLQALTIQGVDASSTIAKAFSFQPCVTEDTTIRIDTTYNHFNDYYTYSSAFTQPNPGDDYAYVLTLKTNSDGSYKYSDTANRIMPSIRYIYENVGIYNGETVNVRVTLSDIHDTYGITINTTTNERITDTKFDHMIFLDHAGIGFCAGRCHVLIEFLNENNEPIQGFKGNVTGTDLDSGQGVWNIQGVDTIYYKNNTIITPTSSNNGVQANNNAASGMYDENGQFLMIVNGNVVEFDWCKSQSSTCSKWSEGRYISFQKAGFLKNETPGPTKEVDKELAMVNSYNDQERLVYTISQYVPYQPIGYTYSSNGSKVVGADYHYTKFVLTDTLPANASLNTKDIRVVNDANEKVTDYFDYHLNGNTLTMSAKVDVMLEEEFYAHTYLFSIPVDIDESTLSSYTTAKGTFVENTVNLIYSQQNGGVDVNGGSAKAMTEFQYQIDSKSDFGSMITPSIAGIIGGSSQKFDYEAVNGYYITSLKVDGKDIEFSKTKGSYTFGNISAYHVIEVTSAPYYTITTSVVNGTIDPNQTKIEKGENRTINYMPNSNYYLESISVDGTLVDIKTNENAYNFTSIKANHDIRVIYQPYLFIETVAINGFISGNNPTMTGNRNEASYQGLRKGDHQLVTYIPQEGYYLDHISVTEYIYNENGSEYTKGKTTTYSTASELNAIMNEYNFNSLATSYRIEVVYKSNPTIMITKTIEGDYNLANGVPSFMYEIKGVDYTGKSHTYYRVISFKDVVEDGMLSTNTLTITDNTIPAGRYTIKEMGTFRYTLKQVNNIENTTVNELEAVMDTMVNEICHVEFVNEQTNFKLYSHNDFVVNSIN